MKKVYPNSVYCCPFLQGIIGSPYGFGYGYTGTNYGTATNTIGGTQYPYARSIDIDHGDGGKSAQDLAYSGQKMQ